MFPSQALAQGIIDSLIAGGVRDFVYCPGSRNAPFAYALARLEAQAKSPIRVHVRLDERSAAFFALGLNLDASASRRRGPATTPASRCWRSVRIAPSTCTELGPRKL